MLKRPITLSPRSVLWGIVLFNFILVIFAFIVAYGFYGFPINPALIPIFIIFNALVICYTEERCHKFFAIRIFRMSGKLCLEELLYFIFILSASMFFL
ncbi:hypothetical protein LS72_005755 [Helicobacter apodemus]|uniref:Uncharacterized protein n=1 Tax=Helicobacter apodemus TaxID=135569 RepID=A0A4U8UID1_9HELI|nr:hypothetical protein [Helicobacter apodemus]TLE15739.1 hypothetical protein LS72_005755 [Helicobacter apodemus]